MVTLCAVDDCERVRGWGQYCKTHGLRNRKYGSPDVVHKSGVDFNVRSDCSMPDCAEKAHAHKLCVKHYSRWRSHGDANVVLPTEGRPPKHGITGYDGAHKRVARLRGPARERLCVDCGANATAWSYDGRDPEQLRDLERGSLYSLKAEHYEPRCTSCHRKFDDAAGKRERGPDGRFLPGVSA